jgi:hypothetical protein
MSVGKEFGDGVDAPVVRRVHYPGDRELDLDDICLHNRKFGLGVGGQNRSMTSATFLAQVLAQIARV